MQIKVPPCCNETDAPTCQMAIENSFPAVREGLQRLFANPMLSDLKPDEIAQAELVLAEVLNNIVEHAYAQYSGEALVLVRRSSSALSFQIIDHGLPLPAADLPKGDLPSIDDFDALPEGGFGWHLIRSLTTNLTYRRQAKQNCLCFRIDIPIKP